MAYSSAISFITDPNDVNIGKIKIVGSQSTVSANTTRVYINITSPDGVKFKTQAASPGDMQIVSNGSATLYFSIPTTDSGAYMNGDYIFEIYTSTYNGSTETPQTLSMDYTYNFCAHNTPGSLLSSKITYAATLSCVTGLLVATDSTDYTTLGLTRTARTNKISPPPVDGRPDVSGASATQSITIQWINVVYETLLSVSYTYNPTPGSLLTGTIISMAGSINTVSVNANCQSNICKSLSCAQDQFDSLYAKACNTYGSWKNVPQIDKNNLSLTVMALSLANMQFKCGNVSKAEELLAIVGQTTNCDCGCSETAAEPTPFVAPT